MTRSRLLLAFPLLLVAFFANIARAQAPLYDVTYTPDPNSSSYAGAAVARAKMQNARGYSSPIVAKAPLPAAAAGAASTTTVIGSQSYNYAIPILRMPGRAGMDLVLNLYYNSRIWDVDTVNSTATFNADRDFPSYGFRLDFGYVENAAGSEYIVTEGNGTKHALSWGQGGMLYSTDGTHIQYNSSTNVLSYKNGVNVQYLPFPSNPSLFRPVWIMDTNGNYFSIAYVSGHDQLLYQISDSLGRVITFNYDSSNRLTSLSQLVHPSGSKTYVTFQWGTKYGGGYAWYNFSGLTVSGAPDLNTPLNVLIGCTYPNNTGYRFTYGDWGIINKIETLSSTSLTRRYISYDYPSAATVLTDAPTYTHQTVSPDGTDTSTSVWTYAITKAGTGVVSSMAITDPNGATSTTSLDPNTGLTSSVQVKDSSNTTLRTMNYTWTTIGAGSPFSTVLDNIVTINDAGQQSKVAYAYDPWANVTHVYEYDFGLALKRHTVTTYGTTGNYVTLHIVNLPTQILVKDGSGNTIARTDLAYDSTALTAVTGAADHDDQGHGMGLTTRGNLTSVTRYSNASVGTGSVTRTFNYDTLGNLRVVQVDCCNQKVFNFSSRTQYSAPDSIVRGPSGGAQFTTSYTYNVDNSLLLSSTDENGQVTGYQYDSMNRLVQTTLPSQGGTAVQINTAFDDVSASPTVTSSSTANSAISITTLDGLDHTMQVDTKNGSSLVSSVEYAYDKLWQRTQVSNPFAPADTIVNTTFTYDALGRVTQVTPPSAGYTQYSYSGNAVTVTDPAGKQRKNFTDALGRLIEVDEPGEAFAGTASSGSVTISGTLQSQSGVSAHGAVSATAQLTITGSEHSKTTSVRYCAQYSRGRCVDWETESSTVYDSGTVSITVNGQPYGYNYSAGSTTTSIAAGLAGVINADGARVVNALLSGSTITLSAVTAGQVGNSISYTTSATWDTSNWSTPSFSSNPTSGNLSGGQDASPGYTVYDSGTVSLTVGSYSATANYGNGAGQDSTSAAVAADLVGKIQAEMPLASPLSISVASAGTGLVLRGMLTSPLARPPSRSISRSPRLARARRLPPTRRGAAQP